MAELDSDDEIIEDLMQWHASISFEMIELSMDL